MLSERSEVSRPYAELTGGRKKNEYWKREKESRCLNEYLILLPSLLSLVQNKISIIRKQDIIRDNQ
ncbi:hypothetical protein DO021_10740 [Desulfobacter hydrogenophilus]|uniref:Uncharacterized protein n=1 Tax=Desulfobacter hydrogenophilus TaxID=2291 RepID=A0A328FB55_9BACT|nr:hypothetical protein [Desulfobacter hydrogenophilus]NDY71990.1 hypothetical protein [Desulfobacter hydrogenophilus]QBH15439.1 hypothetical protein EYB58_22585 [Desulfobacter hydrogenophilus]RAM01914.1 hypothetical protein DO021_10740 [Desulfobacter hydrogenophilus]